MAKYDIDAMLRDGYDRSEVASFVSKKQGYDYEKMRQDGYEDAEILSFVANKQNEKSAYQKHTPEVVKNFLGGAESGARMLWNVPAGFVAKGLGTLAGKAIGEPLDEALKRGDEAASRVSIDPLTEQSAQVDEMLGHGYEYARGKAGEGAEILMRRGSTANDPISRSVGEGIFDLAMFGGLLRGAVGRVRPSKPAEVPKPPVEEPPQRPPTQQPDLFMEDAQLRGQQEIARRQEAARGELETMSEQQRFLQNEIMGQRDLFGEGLQARPPFRESGMAEAAIDSQVPRSPYEPQRTPAQLEKMNRAGVVPEQQGTLFGDNRTGQMSRRLPDENWDLSRRPVEIEQLTPEQIRAAKRGEPYVEYRPEHPTMGMEATTTRGAGPVLADPGFYSFIKGTPRADIVEAINADKHLKGLNTKLERATRILEGIKEQAREPRERQGQYGVRFQEPGLRPGQYEHAGKRRSQAEREVEAFKRAAASQQRVVDRLREQVQSRVQKHEARPAPKIEQTFTTGKYGKLKGKPGGRQAGAVDPSVFIDGIKKLAEETKRWGSQYLPKRGDLLTLSYTGEPTKVIELLERNSDWYAYVQRTHPNGVKYYDTFNLREFTEFENASPSLPPNKPIFPKNQRGSISSDLLTLGLGRLIDGSRRGAVPDSPGLAKRGPKDVLGAATGENRPWEQLKGVLKDIKDLPDSYWNKMLEWGSNAQNVYHASGGNPIVKYIADFAENAKVTESLFAETLTRGIDIGKGILLPKKVVDPNSPFAHWRGLTPKERDIATTIFNKEAATPDAQRALGANSKVIAAVEKLLEAPNKLLKHINAELIAQGRKPINEHPFYMMKNAGTGNWLIRAKIPTGKLDSNGKPVMETIGFHRADTKFGAMFIEKELQKRFQEKYPDLEVSTSRADFNSKGDKFNISTVLLDDIYAALERNDPRRAEIASAINDIKAKGGPIGSRRAFRKGVEGMELDRKNFWKTYEGYINSGTNYVGNLKLGKLMDDIRLTPDMPRNLKQWSLDYLNRARGGANPGELVNTIQNAMDHIFPVKKTVEFGNKAFLTTALLLGNVPFLAGQALQSTAFSPTMLLHYRNNLGYKGGSMSKAFFEAPVTMASRNTEFQGIVDYLSHRGKLDPGLTHEMSLFSGETFFKKAVQMTLELPPRKLEAFGRLHSAAIGYNFLKENGLSGKELKIATERFVDDVMANYSQVEKPGYVVRNGIVGDALSPLSTFKNWFVGMSIVMAKEALNGAMHGQWGKVTPILSLWASTAIFGGITGSLLFKEVDMIFDLLKGWSPFQKAWKAATGEVINEKTPSISERVLTNPDLPDAGKLGVLTELTKQFSEKGVHISGSMTAPEFMPSIATQGMANVAPGVNYAVDIVKFLYDQLGDVTGLSPMSSEARRLSIKSIAPGQLDKIFNNMDTDFTSMDLLDKSGKMAASMNPWSDTKTSDWAIMDRPVPSGKRGAGSVRRETPEDVWASIIGSGTIPEVKEKAAIRDIKDQKEALSERRSKLIDLGVDALMYGREDLSSLIEKAIELEMYNYLPEVIQAYKNRLQTEQERMGGKFKTPTQVDRYDYIERARGN